MMKRFLRMEENVPIAMATSLDPKFKTLVFVNSARVIPMLKEIVTETVEEHTEPDADTQTISLPESEAAEKANSSSIWNLFEEIQAKHTQTKVKSSPPVESEIKL